MISRTLNRLKPAWNFPAPHAATWLALFMPIFAWAQLAYPGYFELHNGFLPIFNLSDLLQGAGDPAWMPVIGAPYDLLRGEGALPYRLAAIAASPGASPVSAIKWILGASIVAGALGMYGWARRQLGSWPALLGEVVYLFLPMLLATVYVRGALAEAVLLALAPWVLWAAEAAVAPGHRWSALVLALTLGAALWTQAGLALWIAGLVMIYVLVKSYAGSPRGRLPLVALLGWAGGMLLGGLFLLPPFLQRGLGGVQPLFADHLLHPYQLLWTGWGAGPSAAGPHDTATFTLGLAAFGLIVLSVLPLGHPPVGAWDDSRDRLPQSSLLGHGRRSSTRVTRYFALTVLLALACLSTVLAGSIWNLLPVLARTLTYPWQLLLLAAPWAAWLAGAGGLALARLFAREPGPGSISSRETRALSLFGALITLVILSSYAYLNPQATAHPIRSSPVAIFGNNEIALLDARITGAPGPGGRSMLSATWQALRPIDRDYTVFVHALTPDGTRWAQVDTMPQAGKLPTSRWRPGQVITDRYALVFGSDAPVTNSYSYLLGLYEWQTGQRLSTGADDKVVLTP